MNTEQEPQAQAEPSAVQFHDHPDFVGGIKWSEIELKWIEARDQKWREAIAKKDAALKACVEALHSIDQQIDLSKYPSAPPDVTLLDELRAAITQAKEAME